MTVGGQWRFCKRGRGDVPNVKRRQRLARGLSVGPLEEEKMVDSTSLGSSL